MRKHPRAHRARTTHRHAPGRHELGQSFLADRRVISTITDLVAATRGPILEIGPGDGAITRPLARLGRPLRALEIDPARATRLQARMPTHVRIEHADALEHRFDRAPHVVVSNVPFHITTALLRRLLHAPGWTDAVLVTQWEVARRRAGVGGASLLTAQAAPWFEFSLHRRIPRGAFRPVPQVDAGLLAVQRRPAPLVPAAERAAFERLVAAVFRAPGGSMRQILVRSGVLSVAAARRWERERARAARGLPKHLDVHDWVDLHARSRRR